MAGIFSDVSTDIQKLRQLKAEIENVKKSLKGIDVNVNVDIAKGMEAQLQSLMKQYDTLVKKVSEAEGKIIISTKRINDASEKIIKAQEQLSKAAGMNTQPSNGNADVSLNNMGTTSVRAQAKAYNELAEEIDSVMGTRSQNIKRMIDEQNAIRLINEEIKRLTKLQIGNSTLTSTQQKRLEQLNNSLLTHKAALSEVRQTLMNNVRLDNAATTSMNGLSQSLSRMRIAYRELTEEERNSPFGKELLASIQQADAKIKELDATIGNHQRNVGNYAKGYNGLNMSVQQIVRELPSAAMGLNTFFLAISNNLPILTDEIKRAKTANEELKTSGQSTIPIWKQLVTSFFSWQSAMMIGITLLTVYGKDISNWVAEMFKSKDALKDVRKAQEEFNAYISKLNEDWRNSVATTAGENIAAYQRLVREYNALGDNMNAKKKFITDNQDAFHELGFSVNGVTDAENLFVRNTDAVVNALVARAKAAAYEQEITDATQRYIKQTEYNNSTVSGGGYYKTIHAGQNWTSTGIVPEELRNLKKGVDYTTISSQTVVSFTLTAAGAARINAQRSREAANRLKRNNEEAKRQLDSVVSRATEGIRQQTDAEQTVYNSLGIKSYAPQSSKKQVKTKNQVLNRAEAIRKQTETLRNLEKRQSLDRKRDAVDLENQVEQARIDTLADGGEKVAAQQALNNKKEMQAIDRAKEEYIQKEIQRQKEIFDATEELKAKKNPKYKKRSFDSSTVSVDTSSFGKLKDFTEQKQLQDRLKAEKEAMNSYLTEYGTYQQRKLAIAEEYAKKIQEAQTEGERLSLGKQRDKAIADVNLSAIKQNIDWAGVFGDFGSMLREEIEHSLDSLRAYMKSDEFRNMDPEDQSKIVEAVNNMRGNVAGNLSDVSFKQIGDLTNELQDAQRRMITTYYAEIDAYGNLKKAQEDYQNAIKNGTPEQKAAAKTNLDTAKTIAKNMSDSYKKAVDEFSATGNNLRDATNKAVDAINSVSSAISQIKSGSLSGAFGGIQQLSETLGKSLSGLSGVLGKAGSELSKFASSLGGATGEIVSAVLGVVDLLKDGLGSIFADLSDLMFNAVNGILDDLLSGGIITKPLQSVVDGVSNILNTITFGGFNSLLGGNDKDVMETVSRLTDSNKYLQESIDRLSERIGDESNTAGQTLDYYITAKDAEEQWRENQQEIIKNLASAWTNTGYGFLGLGGKGTFNGHAPDSNWSGWDSFSKTLKNFGFDITLHNTGDFWELTPEQMALLRDNNPKEWQKLFDSDGHKNPIEAVEEYIEHAGKLEELTDVLNENLTKISFDSLYDNFIDTLMDMDASAEDFADNMSEYFMRAVLSDKVGEMFKTRLNEWYNAFALAMKDGNLDDYELKNLRDDYENIVKDAMAERDDLANAIGYTSSDNEQQSASKKGYATASQDSIDELSGRTTAMYESNLRIETAEQQQTVAITELKGNISALTAQAVGIYNIADETRTILANSYLELQQIRENTGEIVKPIKQMQADIAEVKRNTSRL